MQERCRTPMMVRVVCLRYYSFLFEAVDQIDVSAGLNSFIVVQKVIL